MIHIQHSDWWMKSVCIFVRKLHFYRNTVFVCKVNICISFLLLILLTAEKIFNNIFMHVLINNVIWCVVDTYAKCLFVPTSDLVQVSSWQWIQHVSIIITGSIQAGCKRLCIYVFNETTTQCMILMASLFSLNIHFNLQMQFIVFLILWHWL